MTRNKTLLIAIAAAVAVLLAAFSYSPEQTHNTLTYDELNKMLKDDLADRSVEMSSPVRLQNQDAIEKYCSLFSDKRQQSLVQYCTSTELKDGGGKFLGNIHIVGTPQAPQVIMVLIQTDPLMSEMDTVRTVFDTVINDAVCDCWEDIKPGDLPSPADWIDGLRKFHQSDTQPHSRSGQLKLAQKTMQLELTTNSDGYLWHLFIYS